MLCPQCRRQVGGDGYCPQGHLASPERAAPLPPPKRQPGVPAPAPETAQAPGAPPPLPSDPSLPVGAPKTGRRPLVMALVFGVLVVAVLAFLAFGPAASAANLKYAFQNGETHRYGLAMTFDVNAGSLAFGGEALKGSMEMVLSQKTTAVDEDGVATIQYVVEKIRVVEGKRTVDVPAPPTPLTVRMAPDGRVLEAKGSGLLELGEADPVSDLAGMFGPEAFGPILPHRKVDPGESWDINLDMANPFGETIRYRGDATLVRREVIGGQDAAVIRSATNTPFNFRVSFADLADFVGTDAPSELRDAAMTFNGYFTTDLTQSLATKSGFLLSALGDLKMTGTLGFENIPEQLGNLSAVFNMTFQITMTSIS